GTTDFADGHGFAFEFRESPSVDIVVPSVRVAIRTSRPDDRGLSDLGVAPVRRGYRNSIVVVGVDYYVKVIPPRVEEFHRRAGVAKSASKLSSFDWSGVIIVKKANLSRTIESRRPSLIRRRAQLLH
ncbi:MAG: hypothetical protein KDM91_18810, partial [Verrucomicrobiae bacterium]|nr:hypothetical protein [Verrucomicrobiae bacterium]